MKTCYPGIVDEETAGYIESAANTIENQADADRDATFMDRLQTAGS